MGIITPWIVLPYGRSLKSPIHLVPPLTGCQLTLYPEILGHVVISLALHIIGME